MIFIECYPLKKCQGCVKLIASKVNCFLNINDIFRTFGKQLQFIHLACYGLLKWRYIHSVWKEWIISSVFISVVDILHVSYMGNSKQMAQNCNGVISILPTFVPHNSVRHVLFVLFVGNLFVYLLYLWAWLYCDSGGGGGGGGGGHYPPASMHL